MNWLKKLFSSFLSKLPLLNLLGPVWKPIIKQAIQSEGDKLQTALLETVAKEGPRGIDRNVDKWQADIKILLGKVPLPEVVRARILSFVNAHADKMQEDLKTILAAKGLPAMSLGFDRLQEVLILKIDLL